MNHRIRNPTKTPILPHLMVAVKGVGYAVHQNKSDILVSLYSGGPTEQPIVGYQMSIEDFLRGIREATKMLARIGYKVNE